jgi:hypothetical protein
MNLNNNPTKEQLAELLRPLDDRAAHHVLWVDRGGEVHVTPMPKTSRRPPPPPPEVLDNALVYIEPFWAGNGYVGAAGAANDEWLTDALNWLVRDWAVAKVSGEPVFIEI